MDRESMGDQNHDDKHREHASDTVAPPVLHADINLCEDDLSEEAKAKFGYHTEILNAFQLTAQSILANDRLSLIGRRELCNILEEYYANCKRVLNYLAAQPERKKTVPVMDPPLILCGLPRTGTTLLYNLLACDSTCRAPLLMDMMQPVPPIARSDTAGQTQRNLVASTSNRTPSMFELADFERQFCASHPRHPYEEDDFILLQAGVVFPHPLLAPHDNTELTTWFFDDTNKDFAYEYHKTFLQMLNSVDAPQSHWLLKGIIDTLFLDTLVRCYPSALLVMNHRRLDEVLPSWARLCSIMISPLLNSSDVDVAFDRDVYIKRALYMLDVMIQRMIKFRRVHQHNEVFDVQYDDLVEQPIDAVRRIYKHFGLSYSEDFEQAMVKWLQENPQGKQGRNTYTLEEFGLTSDEIEQRYEEYNSMFLKRRESSKTCVGTTTNDGSALNNINVATKSI